MAKLVGKNYSDMSKAYQKRNSRREFQRDRNSQRMAGEKVSNNKSNSSSSSSSSSGGSSNNQYSGNNSGGNSGTGVRRDYKNDTRGYLNLDRLDYKNSTNESDQARIDRKNKTLQNLDSVDDADRIKKLERRIGKAQGRIDAKNEGEFDGDIENYNFAQYGGKNFDDKDIAFLSSQGFSSNEITQYANNLNRGKIHGSAQVLDDFDIQRDNVVGEDGSYDASAIGRRQDRFTKNDLRVMAANGLSDKESARQLYDQEDSTTRGKRAQELLDKYRNEFQNTTTVTDPVTGVDDLPIIADPTNPSDPTNPVGPGPGPGDPTLPTPTNPGDPTNPYDPTTPLPPGTETVIGGGTSEIINSGNTTITDSFNGGTVDISGTITAGGDFSIDNSNNSKFYGSDVNNGSVATGGSLVSGGAATGGNSQSATDAQALLNNYTSTYSGGGSSSVEGSGNTDIDGSFNGGTVDISGEITAGGDVNIDNSNNSRYYGGDNTNISVAYGAGSNPMNTGVVSHLTTLGYGKPSDSPAAQAKFVDMYSTLNSDNQKKYQDTGTNVAAKFIANAAATNPINYVALNKSISERIQDHYDRSDINQTLLMGDKYNYRPPTFQMPDPLDPVTSNAEDIADDYKDELKD